MITKNIFFCDLVWLLLHTKKLRWRFNSKTRCAVPLPKINMMSAIDTGTSVYQPAKLLNWLYTSLHDTQQTNTFDAFRTESESSPRDRNNKQRSAAAVDLSTALNSNYLINFVQLQRNEVELYLTSDMLFVRIPSCHAKELVLKTESSNVLCHTWNKLERKVGLIM